MTVYIVHFNLIFQVYIQPHEVQMILYSTFLCRMHKYMNTFSLNRKFEIL